MMCIFGLEKSQPKMSMVRQPTKQWNWTPLWVLHNRTDWPAEWQTKGRMKDGCLTNRYTGRLVMYTIWVVVLYTMYKHELKESACISYTDQTWILYTILKNVWVNNLIDICIPLHFLVEWQACTTSWGPRPWVGIVQGLLWYPYPHERRVSLGQLKTWKYFFLFFF